MKLARPFRFLDLPKEIRLMVYERIPVERTHRCAVLILLDANETAMGPYRSLDCWRTWKNDCNHNIAQVHDSVCLAILRVNRQIHSEAIGIMRKKLDYILPKPVRLVFHAQNFDWRSKSTVFSKHSGSEDFNTTRYGCDVSERLTLFPNRPRGFLFQQNVRLNAGLLRNVEVAVRGWGSLDGMENLILWPMLCSDLFWSQIHPSIRVRLLGDTVHNGMTERIREMMTAATNDNTRSEWELDVVLFPGEDITESEWMSEWQGGEKLVGFV